jgi:hypothetical protein
VSNVSDISWWEQVSNASALSWWEQVAIQWVDEDDDHFVLDQQAKSDFYSAISLKQ